MAEINEGYSVFIKIIIPALIAISVKLAIQIRSGKPSIMNVLTSIVIGVGSAYLSGPLVIERFSENYAPLVIGVVTITGEKVAYWIMYKFNVESLLEVFYESVRKIILKK